MPKDNNKTAEMPAPVRYFQGKYQKFKNMITEFREMNADEKRRYITAKLLDNAMIIIIII